MMSRGLESTWIRTGGYGRFRGEWVKLIEVKVIPFSNHLNFLIPQIAKIGENAASLWSIQLHLTTSLLLGSTPPPPQEKCKGARCSEPVKSRVPKARFLYRKLRFPSCARANSWAVLLTACFYYRQSWSQSWSL